ncbi:hypothetical protein PB2503_07599 [Parvularcula bermudensis HTCC2503]|uniref:Chemotaxis protein methyltransferase n=1 Tax=Parvularcula bermudensis (strain ATCC BAA-594 / HTCC2503 / KCTC 12087) TaxID=314260 RepID=E0TFX6_PARBH|nr:protein-glutamate O-methyltransferase [Parvularcula bermudensis]ADM09575.1 hypothetical protein PB2503_07599 [Parvularcula bermudensis HTCC2503]
MSASSAATAQVGDKPEDLTSADFKALSDLVYKVAGLCLSDKKKALISSRLSKRLRKTHLQSLGEYIRFIQEPEGRDELSEAISSLTTNVTSFFRENHHFEFLKRDVFSQWSSGRGPLKIWSAGCSRGAEPYSIAMTAAEFFKTKMPPVKILATDIDGTVLSQAKAGIYDEEEAKSIPPALKRAFMTRSNGPDDDTWQVAPAIRQLVKFNYLNLMDRWPMQGCFDVIFCRNVVIYFDEPTKQKLWGRFHDKIAPGGHMMIGHSERISGPYKDNFIVSGVTTYQKSDGLPVTPAAEEKAQ